MFDALSSFVGRIFNRSQELVFRAVVASGDTVIYSDKTMEAFLDRLQQMTTGGTQAGFTNGQVQRLRQELRTLALHWLMGGAKSFFRRKSDQETIMYLVSIILQQQTQLPARDLEAYTAAFEKGKELDLFHTRLQQYFFFPGGIDPFQVNIPLLGAKQYISTRIAEPSFTTPLKELKSQRPVAPAALRPYLSRLEQHNNEPKKPSKK